MIDFQDSIYLGVASPNPEKDMSDYYTKAETRALVDEKQDIITGAATTITDDNLTENRVVVSNANGKVGASDTTSTELGYVHGVTSAIQAQLNSKANVDLSNLSSDGQMIVDSVNGTISNCVLEIPQNIKLELSNNTIVLKSGSILTMTGSTYSTITTTQDYSATVPSYLVNQRCYVFPNNTGNLSGGFIGFVSVKSGDTLPETGSVFFNTSNKLLYTKASGEWSVWARTYPVCAIDVDSEGNVTFVKDSNGNDMIFNGACFVGHHAVVYPNVSVLYPWGYTDDKHLNSVSVTTNQLYIIELATNRNTLNITGFSSQVSLTTRGADLNHRSEVTDNNIYHYITLENYICSGTSSGVVNRQLTPFVNYTYNGTTVTDFTIRQPIRLATTEMLNNGLAQKQDTLVSGTNIKTINSTSVLGSGNFALADQSLSNLDSNGQMVVDSQNGTISNCILEIPQNIKLTLENNVMTLKAGSILVNSGSTYSTYTTTSDITIPINVNAPNQYVEVFLINHQYFSSYPFSSIVSGATDSLEGTPYHIWFDITNKIIKRYDNQGNYQEGCYPLCVAKVNADATGWDGLAKDSNGNDMIFNGAGFIGHHAFIYPNVKGLIPDGFNEDGSMKSSSRTQNALIIKEITSGSHMWLLVGANNYNLYSAANYYEVSTYKDIIPSAWAYYYVNDENRLYSANGSYVIDENPTVAFFKVTYDGTTVTDFTIRQPVRMATVEMLKDKQNKLTFDTAPTSNSTNPVTSGGVYTALVAKADDNAVVHLAEDETITGNKTFSGTNTFVTPAVSDNSQKPATTAYVNNKFQVVSALPASPDADTFYFIPES